MGETGASRLPCPPGFLRDPVLHRRTTALAGLVALFALAALPSQSFATTPDTPGELARQAVAEALGIVPGEARVVSTEARDFPDASLGCPQPGAAYAQVITPGHQVLVEAEGRRFDVRVAGNGARICYLRKPAVAGSREAASPRESGEAAQRDLARRLDVPSEAVSITALRRLRPGETVDGCGEVCAADAARTACGIGIRLRSGARDFEYVALGDGVRPCPDIAPR